MKYTLLILSLILSSCYTQQKAARQMDKAKSHHEIVAADKCADWYPIIIDSFFVTDTFTVYANNIDHTRLIDSIYKAAMREIKPLPANDTCSTKVQPYIQQIKDLQGLIIGLKATYKPCDTVYRYINNTTTLTKENTAKSKGAEIRKIEAESKYKSWKIACIIFASLFLVSAFANYILLRRK